MHIKINLSKILGERRIKITEFATLAGIANNTVMALYHERAKGITWSVLAKICIALNCKPEDIIELIPLNQEKNNQTFDCPPSKE